MNKILVLDGDHKNALAIVRHLGRTKEYEINIASHKKASICFFSRYVSKKIIVNNPKQEPQKYINDIIEILKKEEYLIIIPVSYISFQLCAKHETEILKYTYLHIASFENIKIASSKIKTYHLAEKLGIPYPKIIELKDVNEIKDVNIEYPCVIKAPFELGKNLVKYAHSKEELIQKFTKMYNENNFGKVLPIIQEYIIGEGAGFFAFYKNGKCENYFIHKRIREYPTSGGASVVAEAFYNEQIFNDGKKILDELKWKGVAMVEFKKNNKTGKYNLMEINAKFWGSLDLALVCGANFPKMLIDSALNKNIEKWDYKQKRFQWILNGDLFHLLERPWKIFKFIKDFIISKNDFWIRDILPNLFQLVNIPIHYYKKWFK